eukprot:TRINITY_DN40783_c0_g1_i2.p3 TRINITY_DN40783_c0_g1~~TRINITY_DN40783_c0_g1_i2.p3  ORF type:complete len:172 (+),score=32.45 TRINITY_DN40783_c0_g1_i2:3-518(+)
MRTEGCRWQVLNGRSVHFFEISVVFRRRRICNGEWGIPQEFSIVVFFFSSRRRHTRCREVSWARRCVQETGLIESALITKSVSAYSNIFNKKDAIKLANKELKKKDELLRKIIMLVEAVSYTHLTLPTILLVQISVVAVSLKKKRNSQTQYTAAKSTTQTTKCMQHNIHGD